MSRLTHQKSPRLTTADARFNAPGCTPGLPCKPDLCPRFSFQFLLIYPLFPGKPDNYPVVAEGWISFPLYE